MKLKKRILSLLLCGAMLFSLCSQSVLAEENGQAGGVTIGTSGLCEHQATQQRGGKDLLIHEYNSLFRGCETGSRGMFQHSDFV